MNTTLKEVLDIYEDLAIHKSIEITVNEMKTLNVTMNRDLAFLMLSNLLKNAIVHNNHNGNITIEINDNFLKISNTGIPEALPSTVFNRYEHAQNLKSTGLGLSIVKSITDFYNSRIEYSFQNNRHSFQIVF